MIYKVIIKRASLVVFLFLAIWLAIAYLPKPYDVFDISPPIQSESIKVAVIYAKRIKEESKPYKLFESYFESEREKMHQEFLAKELLLRDKAESIKKLPTLKNKQRLQVQKLNKELQKEIIDLENELQNQKEAFLKRASVITQNLQKLLDKSIQSTIKKFGFNLVLNAELDDKMLVMYTDKKFDITSEIIKNLNSEDVQF
jgi:Skp family chaperone for outer membrane proteins